MIDEELEADIDMAYRYGIVLCLARAPPQVCAPTRHTGQFFICGYMAILVIFFQDIDVPNEVIYTSMVFGKESQVLKVSFYAILGQKNFENFTPKS